MTCFVLLLPPCPPQGLAHKPANCNLMSMGIAGVTMSQHQIDVSRSVAAKGRGWVNIDGELDDEQPDPRRLLQVVLNHHMMKAKLVPQRNQRGLVVYT